MNLPVTLGLLGAGGLLVWAGIAKPEGGLWAEVGRVLDGAPTKLAAGPSPAQGAALAAAFLTGPTAGPSAGAGSAAGKAAALIGFARSQLGEPYRWGGTGPDAWDCSGLTQAAAASVGVELPRVAAAQQGAGAPVPGGLADALPGDFVFYGFPAYHCAIYLGGRRIIHAPYTGTVVREENVTGPGAVANVRRIVPARATGGVLPA